MRRLPLVSLLSLGLIVIASCAVRDKGAAAPEASAGPPSGAAQQPAAPGYGPSTTSAVPPPGAGGDESGGEAYALPKDEKKSKDDGLLSDDPKLSKLEDAEKALASAENSLNAVAKTPSSAAPHGGTPPPAKKPAPSTPADPGESTLSAGQPRCENACKAFESLRRAAGAVCRIAGNDDPRCARAKDLVKTNETRVAVCKCNGNGG